MPQWTLAVVWQNLFNSNAVVGTSNGLAGIPVWQSACRNGGVRDYFPAAVVLGLHYAPFAYILIGGIFRNMDANLEEAATILDTPKWKTMFRITLPMVKPAILSTVLLVFGSAMGSYPVPHYLGLYDSIHQVYLHELQVYRGGQYSCHYHDGIRSGNSDHEPGEFKEQKELYHSYR